MPSEKWAVAMNGTDFDAFVVAQDRKVGGAGDVVFLKFGRGADVDDFIERAEVTWESDGFDGIEHMGRYGLTPEWVWSGLSDFHYHADFNSSIQRKGRNAEGNA